MSIVGKIKTLFSDKDKSEALFPRTKISAVSDDDGTGLNVILENKADRNEIPTTADKVGAAPQDHKLESRLVTAGWYKIGTFISENAYSASVKLHIGGSYYNNTPVSALIEITSGYYWANARTIVPANPSTYGLSKIAVKKSNEYEYTIYAFYNLNYDNQVYITIREMTTIFTPINFELVTDFDESSALTIANVYADSTPDMLPGVEYITTERWNGKIVYTKLVNCGNLPASGERDIPNVIPTQQKIIRCEGCSSDGWAMPIIAQEGDVRVSAFGSTIRIVAGRDLSSQTVDVTIWYVKD